MQALSPGLPATHAPLADVLELGNTVLQLESITQARLTTFGTAEIVELSDLLEAVAGRIKSAQGEILKTFTSRYGEQAKAQLLAQGKDSGTTHVIDGALDISVEIGKAVAWDQTKLPAIWDRIAATGEDPRQYIEVKYSVSEAKFKAWPQTLREPFEALRTVTPKAPKFVLRAVGEGQ